jgi:hypothetical protein
LTWLFSYCNVYFGGCGCFWLIWQFWPTQPFLVDTVDFSLHCCFWQTAIFGWHGCAHVGISTYSTGQWFLADMSIFGWFCHFCQTWQIFAMNAYWLRQPVLVLTDMISSDTCRAWFTQNKKVVQNWHGMGAVIWSPGTLYDGTTFVSYFVWWSCEIYKHEYDICGVERYPSFASDTNRIFCFDVLVKV